MKDISHPKDFLRIKGSRVQIEDNHSEVYSSKNLNKKLGFKSVHYLVTESCGQVKVTVKRNENFKELVHFGIRTAR